MNLLMGVIGNASCYQVDNEFIDIIYSVIPYKGHQTRIVTIEIEVALK